MYNYQAALYKARHEQYRCYRSNLQLKIYCLPRFLWWGICTAVPLFQYISWSNHWFARKEMKPNHIREDAVEIDEGLQSKVWVFKKK